MTDEKPTRRELMKPVQLLGIAFACALFAGGVTAISTGLFTTAYARDPHFQASLWQLTGVISGVTFIVVVLGLSLLLLAVNPADVNKTIDEPILMEKDRKNAEKNTDDE